MYIVYIYHIVYIYIYTIYYNKYFIIIRAKTHKQSPASVVILPLQICHNYLPHSPCSKKRRRDPFLCYKRNQMSEMQLLLLILISFFSQGHLFSFGLRIHPVAYLKYTDGHMVSQIFQYTAYIERTPLIFSFMSIFQLPRQGRFVLLAAGNVMVK